MQQLAFEAAWDKTISKQDREEIELAFQKSLTKLKDEAIPFTTIWIAQNYKEELLVTALVHNQTNEPLRFHQTSVELWDGDKRLANHIFTIPSLHIKANTSMPWTFIFPRESYELPETIKNGKLKLGKGAEES